MNLSQRRHAELSFLSTFLNHLTQLPKNKDNFFAKNITSVEVSRREDSSGPGRDGRARGEAAVRAACFTRAGFLPGPLLTALRARPCWTLEGYFTREDSDHPVSSILG